MKKLKMMVLVAAMSALPSAFAATDRVPGEKLDSGLGQLGASYTAWEFMPAGRLLGESLDNGLGKLAVLSNVTYDLPILVGIVLLAATFIITANIIVDLLYAVIDPRVKYA